MKSLLSSGRRHIVVSITAILATIIGTTAVFAGVSSTTGAIVEIAPPPSVAQSVTNSPDIWVFPEFTGPLATRIVMDKRKASLTYGLSVGTPVTSYFIHLRDHSGAPITGDIVFDEPVLGVVHITRRLNSSDAIVGVPSTLYPSEPGGGGSYLRGLERSDSVTFPDNYTVRLSLRSSTAADQIRVFTEPAAFAGPIEVDVDIKPGSDKNPVNTKSKGVIPVAILGSDDFDVADVDVESLAFGPDGAAPAHSGHIEDVNDDGIGDLVLHFPIQDTCIASNDTEACLTGTAGDDDIEGCDTVSVK